MVWLFPALIPQVRQVDLDTIPADLVGSIAINKTLSANQDGDAIGGSVDLRIKQATTDRPRLVVRGHRAVYTRSPASAKSSALIRSRACASVRTRQPGKRFGVMLGYSYDYNGRGIDDVEPITRS